MVLNPSVNARCVSDRDPVLSRPRTDVFSAGSLSNHLSAMFVASSELRNKKALADRTS
jgi:hypothetical protein